MFVVFLSCLFSSGLVSAFDLVCLWLMSLLPLLFLLRALRVLPVARCLCLAPPLLYRFSFPFVASLLEVAFSKLRNAYRSLTLTMFRP